MNKKLQTAFCTRQYMLSKDFELYYYSDYHLTKVENHTHDYYEFYFFLEGNVTMEISGEEYHLKAGDIVLIPPNVAHHANILDRKLPYRRFVFWLSREYADQLVALSFAYGYLMDEVEKKNNYVFSTNPIIFNTIRTKVFHLLEEIYSERFGKAAEISLCVNELLLHINRIVYEQQHTERTECGQSLYEQIFNYVDDHLGEELSLSQISAKLFVNKYYISHIFKENTGMSIHQYITKKRLDACYNAIKSGAKITEIYLMYGFKDYSSFYRSFKKEYGISPKECRELELKKQILSLTKSGYC
ncbi:MAG: AraC family transcriptional regulator [Clostridia bacterium]|nr:AraC family transcriptional regulator [Clostridia bacterium]